MKHYKRISLLIILVALIISMSAVFSLFGCQKVTEETSTTAETKTESSTTQVQESSTTQTQESSSTQTAEEITIGYVPLSMEVAYFKSIVKYMEVTAKELGVKFVVKDTQGDAAKEATAIEDLVTMGANAIIIYAIDNKTIPASVDYCHEKGVKVISHLSSFENADINAGLDEYVFGKISGEESGKYIAEKMGGKAEIALLDLDTMGGKKVERSKGVVDGIAKFAPDAKIVARASAFAEEKAMDAVETMLTENPGINFLVACNDSGCYGAIAAIESKGFEEKVKVACIGNEKRTLEYIVDGKILWTVDSGAEATGEILIKEVYNMLTGKDYKKDIIIPVSLITPEIAKEQLSKLS